MKKLKRNYFLITTSSIIGALILAFLILPSYILSFEPQVRPGELYFFIAKKNFYQGRYEQAREELEISLDYYPQNRLAQDLNTKLKEIENEMAQE